MGFASVVGGCYRIAGKEEEGPEERQGIRGSKHVIPNCRNRRSAGLVTAVTTLMLRTVVVGAALALIMMIMMMMIIITIPHNTKKMMMTRATLLPTSLPVSIPDTIHHSRLTVCV